MSYVSALLKSLLLVLLIAIPYLVYRWAKMNRPTRTGVLTGATFGLVVSPVSLGLYLLGFLVPLIGMLPGLVGLVLTTVSRSPSISAVNTFWVPGTWCRREGHSLCRATFTGWHVLGCYVRSCRIYF
jgi:hypothetical protein